MNQPFPATVRRLRRLSRSPVIDVVILLALIVAGTLLIREPAIAALAEGAYFDKPAEAIRGSGYVVECLEAALWCFHHTDSFEDAVLAAANLGDDADTTAAVCGQLAGAHYGIAGIPGRWLQKLAARSMIEQMAMALDRGESG